MKRRLLKLGVFLLLGAIVNVAVAWIGNAQWTFLFARSNPSHKGGVFTLSNEWLDYSRWDGMLFTELTWSAGLREPTLDKARQERLREPPYWTVVSDLPRYQREGVDGHTSHLSYREVGTGFPMVAFVWCGQQNRAVMTPITTAIRFRDYTRLSSGFAYSSPSILPLHPVWPGFAINTIFYAAILALLLYAPGKVRRRIRVHRSQCAACGHIIAAGTCANGLCSECGSPLPEGFKPKPAASAHT